MALFKYAQKKHADALVLLGEAQLSAPRYFREFETNDCERSDPNECVTRIDGLKLQIRPHQPVPKALSHVIGEGCWIDANRVLAQRTSQNILLYSVCLKYDRSIENSFGGACVEIFDSVNFATQVSDQLGKDFTFLGLHHCIYTDSPLDFRDERASLDPYLRKDLRFQLQFESRFVWQSSVPVLNKTLLVHIKDPAKCSRLFEERLKADSGL
jgi:hypothetical protein